MPKFPFWVDATDADDDDGCRRRFLKAEREREGGGRKGGRKRHFKRLCDQKKEVALKDFLPATASVSAAAYPFSIWNLVGLF